MPKLYTYKNGITGIKYKDFFLVRRDNCFCVLKNTEEELFQGTEADCRWYIDKASADPEEESFMKEKYSEDLYSLNNEYLSFLREYSDKRMPKDVKRKFNILETIRNRKASDLPY